eukprot:12503941-Heterocapsa_arctica.AAC.1
MHMLRDSGDIVRAVDIRVPDEEDDLDWDSEDRGCLAAVGTPQEWFPEAAAAAAPAAEPRKEGPGEAEKQNAAKLVDMRGVAHPPPFSGDDAAWQDWRFRFQTITALLDMRE